MTRWVVLSETQPTRRFDTREEAERYAATLRRQFVYIVMERS